MNHASVDVSEKREIGLDIVGDIALKPAWWCLILGTCVWDGLPSEVYVDESGRGGDGGMFCLGIQVSVYKQGIIAAV